MKKKFHSGKREIPIGGNSYCGPIDNGPEDPPVTDPLLSESQ